MKKQAAHVPHHNYQTKLLQTWKTGELPRTAGYHQVTIWHDDDCGIFVGQRCNCDPDITLKFSLDGHAN